MFSFSSGSEDKVVEFFGLDDNADARETAVPPRPE